MLKDFERRHRVEVECHERRFFYDDDGGYAFPCDKEGMVDVDSLNPTARKNYEWCLHNPQEFKYYNEHNVYYTHYTENASGVCSCGNRIELWDEYLGACHCPHCGKWYNLFGQELNPPHTWKDGDDW